MAVLILNVASYILEYLEYLKHWRFSTL